MKKTGAHPNLETLEERTSCSALHPGHFALANSRHHPTHKATRAAQHAPAHPSARLRAFDYLPQQPPQYCAVDLNFPWGMHLNDTLGDCVAAAQINILESQLQTIGYRVVFPDSSALVQYERVGGYVPGNPATDRGETVISAELDWVRNGYLDPSGYTHKALAWGPVNFRNYDKLAKAVYLYGGVTLTCALPSDSITQFVNHQTWTVTTGPGGAPWSGGAHEIAVNGYNYIGPLGVTWGREVQMTWAWMSTYCTEGYATVTVDECYPNGHTPQGLTTKQLISDLKYVS